MKGLLRFFLTIGYGYIVVWDFLKIDRASHSVSDTLISFVPILALFTVIYVLLFIIINDLDIIFSKETKPQRR